MAIVILTGRPSNITVTPLEGDGNTDRYRVNWYLRDVLSYSVTRFVNSLEAGARLAQALSEQEAIVVVGSVTGSWNGTVDILVSNITLPKPPAEGDENQQERPQQRKRYNLEELRELLKQKQS